MEEGVRVLLEFDAASIAFGGKVVLRPFDLRIRVGDVVMVTGPSGGGKSSLLRLAAGLLSPGSGVVRRSKALRLGFAFQNQRLLPWRTAWQNVAIPLLNDGWAADRAERRARELLAGFGLREACDHWPLSLSGGMAQRVSLARAIAVEPDLLLLDEPMAGLDRTARENTCSLIAEACARPWTAALIASHHANDLSIPVTHTVYCGGGQLMLEESESCSG